MTESMNRPWTARWRGDHLADSHGSGTNLSTTSLSAMDERISLVAAPPASTL